MRVDEGSEEIGIASMEESKAAGEHGMDQMVVPIAFVQSTHTHVFLCLCMHECVWGATVCRRGDPRSH